jgi:hypothetical protein
LAARLGRSWRDSQAIGGLGQLERELPLPDSLGPREEEGPAQLLSREEPLQNLSVPLVANETLESHSTCSSSL